MKTNAVKVIWWNLLRKHANIEVHSALLESFKNALKVIWWNLPLTTSLHGKQKNPRQWPCLGIIGGVTLGPSDSLKI